jgi:3',5'-cyclic-AMP phosphodiesterase
MLIAQISDMHIKAQGKKAYQKVDTSTMLERCVERLNRLSLLPGVVIATGDLVDGGSVPEYKLLRDLLSPIKQPLYLIPGNHDERLAMREVFSDHSYLFEHDEFVLYSQSLGEMQLIGIDTVVTGKGSGLLCRARLEWLDNALSDCRKPTIVAMHHPPFKTGIAHMDLVGLEGCASFEAIIRKHPHVERIVCGHLHRSIQARIGHTVASTCPSTAHQVTLDLAAGAPDCFSLEPPAFALHLWSNGLLVSHIQLIDDYPGPFPFRMNGLLID